MKESNSVVSLLKKSFFYLPSAFALFTILVICIYQSTHSINFIDSYITFPTQANFTEAHCDYTEGEWVRDDAGPLYNGTSCKTMSIRQNCMVSGRPDREYLQWRWNPNQCQLPRFDPETFLDLMKNKHIAFVGDSLARNQFQSLLCMVSTVAEPQHVYGDKQYWGPGRWNFTSHNAIFTFYWSQFLVKGTLESKGSPHNTMFLDTIDESWASELRQIDILVLSVGRWFMLPLLYYRANSIIGCHELQNCTTLNYNETYGKALETTFDEIIRSRMGFSDKNLSIFLTTFFHDHYSHLGNCSETQPYNKGSEPAHDWLTLEMRKIQMEKLNEARSRSDGISIEALDISDLAIMRRDGHPGIYSQPLKPREKDYKNVWTDCVQWCLPGPIDTWNQIMFDRIIKHNNKY